MFEKREDGFENAFAHDEELRFKTLARRNRLLGLWAAQKLGMADQQALIYANALVDAQVLAADDEAVIAQLRAALAKIEPQISEHRLRQRLAQAAAEAVQQVQAGV